MVKSAFARPLYGTTNHMAPALYLDAAASMGDCVVTSGRGGQLGPLYARANGRTWAPYSAGRPCAENVTATSSPRRTVAIQTHDITRHLGGLHIGQRGTGVMDHDFVSRQALPNLLERQGLELALGQRIRLGVDDLLEQRQALGAVVANLDHQCEPNALDGPLSHAIEKLAQPTLQSGSPNAVMSTASG